MLPNVIRTLIVIKLLKSERAIKGDLQIVNLQLWLALDSKLEIKRTILQFEEKAHFHILYHLQSEQNSESCKGLE